MLNLVMRNSWLAIGASFAAMIGSGMLVRSLPYERGLGAKQAAWMLHSSVMGALVAPLCLLGGPHPWSGQPGTLLGWWPVFRRWPRAPLLRSSSTMGGPLAIGLGFVFASSLGSMFLPASTALGAGLYSISMVRGPGPLRRLPPVRHAAHCQDGPKSTPPHALKPYDPINASISIYLDTLNIFIRIAMILAGGGSRRK
uniref:Putative growth-hormone inducible transmembrane protein n=1 Tax=Ixodes ricinus TaxID=34613 RepID=V5IBK0_IXORI